MKRHKMSDDRYLLFGFETDEGSGGMADALFPFNSFAEFQDKFLEIIVLEDSSAKFDNDDDNYQVFDTESREWFNFDIASFFLYIGASHFKETGKQLVWSDIIMARLPVRDSLLTDRDYTHWLFEGCTIDYIYKITGISKDHLYSLLVEEGKVRQTVDSMDVFST